VKSHYDFTEAPVLAAKLELKALFASIPDSYMVQPIPTYPPVLEDIAVIVKEKVAAKNVEILINQAGGKILSSIDLFDVFHSHQIGEGKKSLAYHLTYQAYDRTLTDEEISNIRKRIIQTLEKEMDAQIRMADS
jgi:phenylalanyl-tRNA synthetase beta chain